MTALRFISVFVGAAVLSSAQGQDKCTLEGRVLNVATGAPLEKATVSLALTGQPTSYAAISNAEGKFLFKDLDPGMYLLLVDRTGFVPQNYGGRRLKLDPGQHMQHLVFKLVAQGMIYGKVTDEEGDPAPISVVQILSWSYVRGKKQLQPLWGGQRVQSDGTFVIGLLPPGRYCLRATDKRDDHITGIMEPSGRRGPEEGYVTTYFPNAVDPSAAAPIEISAGAEVRGIEIRLRKTRVFHIRGTVSPPRAMVLTLASKDGDVMTLRDHATFSRDKDGVFEFHHIPPGRYLIEGGVATELVGRTDVNVGDGDTESVLVQLRRGAEIIGSVKPPARLIIELVEAEGLGFYSRPIQSTGDGSFQIRGIGPYVYRVYIDRLPPSSYVKSIRFEGQDVTKGTLDLSSGTGGQLEILLSPTAADVTGVVRNSTREVMVQIWRQGDDIAKTANTDQSGNFKFSGLAPGDYRIVAWEDIDPGLAQDPAFRARFDSQATTVKLRDNSHETTEVKLIAKDAIEAEAAKVR